jgi:saccharopine dehydrogenase-like NADP-dependent oxidoreductase
MTNRNPILIIGAGRIGKLSALLLEEANYKVFLADNNPSSEAENVILLDVQDKKTCEKLIKKNHITTLVCCLPYFQTVPAFEIAQDNQLHYFDLTEDAHTSRQIRQAVDKSAAAIVMTQCGLAPGWVGVLTHDLTSRFEQLDAVRLRVGGLPQYAHNVLHYGITWSLDGVINQYGNACEAIEQGKHVILKPLEDVEELEIDGMLYEAFNTSGGLGNLIELYKNKVRYLKYKTIRYPGHAEKMRFLMNDLRLNEDRQTLKAILKNALPVIDQDVVIMDIAVTGKIAGKLQEQTIVKKYYPQKLNHKNYSALQITTAASLCAAIVVVLRHPQQYKGLQYQETIPLEDIQKSVFAKYL